MATHCGILTFISEIGNSYRASFKILYISFSTIFSTLVGMTGTPYSSFKFSDSVWASLDIGFVVFSITINGFPISFSSSTIVFSASKYSFLGISPIEPSVVTTIPIVEWSFITFSVPISAASTKGIASSYHGVLTYLGPFSSSYPLAALIT